MRPTILFQSILSALLIACAIGCSEDPASSVPGQPQPPRDLVVRQIDSANDITAEVSWHAPADSNGSTGYRIWWNEMWDGPIDSIDVDASTRVAAIEGLRSARRYAISVATLRGTLRSERRTVEWISGGHAPLSPPRYPMAATAGSTWINLTWTSPINAPAGVTYLVSWAGPNRGYTDSGYMGGINTNFHMVTSGLRHGVEYTFYVRAVHEERLSEPATIVWAGAVNYDNDARNPGRLRLYEQASAKHSALIIDPSRGGPGGITVDTASSDVQLGLYLLSDSTFLVGPAYAITEFSNAASFDPDVYVSRSSYAVLGLDAWYSPMPIDQYIPSDGNLRAFTVQSNRTDLSGVGFYLRTGHIGDYHFARVFLRNVGRKILQGTAPDRYVDVDLSYQIQPNLPYAKRLPGEEPPAVFVSQRRR